MTKKTILSIITIGWMFPLFFLLVACTTGNETASTSTVQVNATATPTSNKTDFAATVSGGGPVNRNNEGDNLTTIHSPADRPVAKLTKTTLNVPPKARGAVYIQNDSDTPMTIVSDTANGFATFTIAPNTTSELVFHRAGTFKAHIKGYPVSTDTTLTIIITAPYPA